MINWKVEWKILLAILAVFLVSFYLPVEWLQTNPRIINAVWESLYLVRDYAQQHVILCLVPAFFIAGAISVFISQASVMKYLGPNSNKVLAYGVASVSGTILAVCSCTVLPLFAGIYRMGAGLGPATAFLYSGPAINVLAIILTARVLGIELGVARAVGAVVFSIVIGLLMHLIFIKEEQDKIKTALQLPETKEPRTLWQNVIFLAAMVGILVFANWGDPKVTSGIYYAIYANKWIITSVIAFGFGAIMVLWFKQSWWKLLLIGVVTFILALLFPNHPIISFAFATVAFSALISQDQTEAGHWFNSTWTFAKQILPLLFVGVLIAGGLLGRPGHEGLIPNAWVEHAVGGNSLAANFFASVAGAFMYFATLTEVPILQGLISSGMGKGPALALLLAGPALSLPNMLVLNSIMGTKKTVVFVTLVIVMATLTGIIYGTFF